MCGETEVTTLQLKLTTGPTIYEIGNLTTQSHSSVGQFHEVVATSSQTVNLLVNVITSSKCVAPKWSVTRKMYEFLPFIMLAMYFAHLIVLGSAIVM